MTKVYAIQQPKRLDPRTGQLVDHVDLEPAREHGELHLLLQPGAGPFKDLDHTLEELRNGLAEFTDQDVLLLVGNPVLIGLATAIAADLTNGHVTFLQWSGARREYIKVCANYIYGDLLEDS